MGLVGPLGMGKTQTTATLFAGSRAGLRLRDDVMPARAVYVGAVEASLPAVPPAYATRNNRMMLAALDQIRAEVAAVARCFGRDRIAVVLGTSTSGIAEG